MFVVRPERLDERHRGQVAADNIGVGILLVLQVVRPTWSAVGVIRVIRKWLMVELEHAVTVEWATMFAGASDHVGAQAQIKNW